MPPRGSLAPKNRSRQDALTWIAVKGHGKSKSRVAPAPFNGYSRLLVFLVVLFAALCLVDIGEALQENDNVEEVGVQVSQQVNFEKVRWPTLRKSQTLILE